MREGVDRDDFRAGGVWGGSGGICAPGVPPHPALFMIFMLPGRPFDLAARGDAQTDPPALDPPHAKGGVASFSEVEPRANIEGGGGTSGQPGRDAGAIRGCNDISLAHCAFNPAPRGKSPLGLTTPPTTPRKRWGEGSTITRLTKERGRGVNERSIPYRIRIAERNDIRAGLLMPRTPEIGMISAGVDRSARGLGKGKSPVFLSFSRSTGSRPSEF